MLKTRVKTACVFVPVCALIVLFSGAPYVLNIAVALLNIGAAWELFSVANARGNYALLVPALIAAAALPFLPLPYYPAGALIVLLAALGAAVNCFSLVRHRISPVLCTLYTCFVLKIAAHQHRCDRGLVARGFKVLHIREV